MSGYPTGLVAGAGLSKETVNYRLHEECQTCAYFYPANSCRKVAGNISPKAVCNLWELTDSTGKTRRAGKEFFEKEHNKPTFNNPRASRPESD